MPTYEYACRDCGQHLEVVQSFTDDPLETCEHCGGRLRKVFSAAGIIFKGSGYYVTDTRGDRGGSSGSSGSGSGSGSSGSGSSDADSGSTSSSDGSSSSSSGDSSSSSGGSSSSSSSSSDAKSA